MPKVALPKKLPDPAFSAQLMAWQHEHGRNQLPWMVADPYRRWLSEIMLQQTRVGTVIPYFERFLATFPDVRSLAAAPEEAVLALWSGLGYYARARNLHACAKRVVADFGGHFPQTVEELSQLPGIGQSTACAIAAAAFGVKAPILDANARRVFARLCACDLPAGSSAEKEALWQLAWSLVPEHHADVFNQALMDLGTLVCTTKKPACTLCPVLSWCVAGGAGKAELYPTRRVKAPRPVREQTFLLWQRPGCVWLEPRPVKGGVWPGLLCPLLIKDAPSSRALRFTHDFSHYRLLAAVEVRPWQAKGEPSGNGRWLELTQVSTAALPAPIKKLLLSLQASAPARADAPAAGDAAPFRLRP